jgi:hypothetical protein
MMSTLPKLAQVTTVAAILAAACPLFAQARSDDPTYGIRSSSGDTMPKRYNWSSEDTYWHEHYSNEPYYSEERDYTVYQPAYRYGVDTYYRYHGRPYSELDPDMLEKGWGRARGNSELTWEEAQLAAHSAYERLYNNNHNSTTGTHSQTNDR